MAIRARVSAILDVPIGQARWVAYTDALDREGKFTKKSLLEIVLVLCEELEALEAKIDERQSAERTL